MRNTGDKPSKRRELLGLDQRILGFPQMSQRGLGRVLCPVNLLLTALALADVDMGADPAIDDAGCIAQRNGAGQERTILSVLSEQRKLRLQRHSGCPALRSSDGPKIDCQPCGLTSPAGLPVYSYQ